MSGGHECGIYLPRHMGTPRDVTGCLLPDRHEGEHECRTESNGRIAWQNDDECTCPDCNQCDDTNDWCVIYREATP